MDRKLPLCIVGLVVVAAAGAALYLAAGRPVPISQVLREPAAYEGKSVTVAGTVDVACRMWARGCPHAPV